MNREQRRAAKKGEKVRRRKEKKMGQTEDPLVSVPGQITVTQNDLFAQIGVLTMENTVLKNQLAQAQTFINQLMAERAGKVSEETKETEIRMVERSGDEGFGEEPTDENPAGAVLPSE